MLRTTLVFFLGIGLFTGATATATTIRGFTTRDMVREAAVVVRGEVLTRTSLYNAEHTRIYTDSVVRILEAPVGTVMVETLTVRQIGGRVGEARMVVPGVAPIQVGEEVVLFLRTDGVHYFLVGMAQGKFRVERDPKSGVRTVSRRVDGLHIVFGRRIGRPPLGSPAKPTPWPVFRASLRAFAQELGR